MPGYVGVTGMGQSSLKRPREHPAGAKCRGL